MPADHTVLCCGEQTSSVMLEVLQPSAPSLLQTSFPAGRLRGATLFLAMIEKVGNSVQRINIVDKGHKQNGFVVSDFFLIP